MYLVKIPHWAQRFYPHRLWQVHTQEKILFLTFDDGPHTPTTEFILGQLRKYNAKGTFFCIGKNVEAENDLYQRILQEGHRTGIHSQHHLNGWKEDLDTYVDDMMEARQHIHSNLFRPPYGRMTKKEEAAIKKAVPDAQIVMWHVLSGDFDPKIDGVKCWENVKRSAGPGSIIVFHDSAKARERMEYTLPRTLEYFSKQGYRFEALP